MENDLCAKMSCHHRKCTRFTSNRLSVVFHFSLLHQPSYLSLYQSRHWQVQVVIRFISSCLAWWIAGSFYHQFSPVYHPSFILFHSPFHFSFGNVNRNDNKAQQLFGSCCSPHASYFAVLLKPVYFTWFLIFLARKTKQKNMYTRETKNLN